MTGEGGRGLGGGRTLSAQQELQDVGDNPGVTSLTHTFWEPRLPP
jgi:hypothetical protein